MASPTDGSTAANPEAAPRGIDAGRVGAWLVANVPGATAPFRYRLIAGGHSNLTVAVDDSGGHRYVIRRPPIGGGPPGAHDVAREYRIISAIAPTGVPVAPALGLCLDEAVNGAPFYVMGFVLGTVIDTPGVANAALPDAASRRLATEDLVDTLVKLHRQDIDAIGLGDLGRREAYVGRQLTTLHRIWKKTKTRDLPAIESVHARLSACVPAQRRSCLVHCDYRLGNVIVGGDHRVAAVLDWELCAVGDPRADLAYLLCGHEEPDDPFPSVWMVDAPTRAGGFPTREDIIRRYADASGLELENLDYFRAFAYWRIAMIAEGMKRRYASGAMGVGGDLEAIEERVLRRAALAEDFMRRAETR